MLLNLNIKNFLLIEELNLDLDKGLIAITGETGAGKSMIIDAILYALGAKVGNIILHKKATFCFVTLTFKNSNIITELLTENYIDLEDNLIITRGQTVAGKKKIVINGQVVSIKILQEISEKLLDIYGQNTHTDLFLPRKQLEVVDEYANNNELKIELLKQYRIWYDANKQVNEFNQRKVKIQEEIDYLKVSIQELEEVNVKSGEENELVLERIDLQNKIKSNQLLANIIALLKNDNLHNNLILAARQLLTMPSLQEFQDASEEIEKALINIEKAIEVLSNLERADNMEFKLESIEERIFHIRDLSRKYKVTCDNLPNILTEYQNKLQLLESDTKQNKQLHLDLDIAKNLYLEIAINIRKKRQEACRLLEKKINQELQELEMIYTSFNIELQELEMNNIGPLGLDDISFTAVINPGSAKANITKIASGGELSRLMLAIMTSFAAKTKKPLVIFDEIDSGTSGVAASSIASKLKALSTQAQVVVITHQAQIAAKADQHLFVYKKIQDNNTSTVIKNIEDQYRPKELARMIAGSSAGIDANNAAVAMMKKD